MPHRVTFLAALAALLSGCGGGSEGGAVLTTPMPVTLAGVYAGELPCSNCAAIEATLWLRSDERFFLRQHLRDDTANAPAETKAPPGPSTTYALGRWHWDEVAAQVVLRGAGPDRRLTARDEDHLALGVTSPVAHLLARDPTAPPFDDRVTLDGESSVSENGATFIECLTGLALQVGDAGAYRELRRQHRRMNPRGKIALTTVEAHLVTTTRESTTSERLVVDRFITMKPGRGCAD